MSSRIIELFGHEPAARDVDWSTVIAEQLCPFTGRPCSKTRKSAPKIAIGTCTVLYGRGETPLVICPDRLKAHHQVFTDCLHLLTRHEPGNQLHIVDQVQVPGGSVDHFLTSSRNGRICDFVGIELQSLDTTGTVWPLRQHLAAELGVLAPAEAAIEDRPFGMNWKMTAKTTLVQMHHKVATFQHLGKHLVLVLQDHLLQYMQAEFNFAAVGPAQIGQPVHLHPYSLVMHDKGKRCRNVSGAPM